eukprot:GHVS01007792.1.p1 GENE.GHVS01007792.1~~GHVS01007792.1.p1  ORF type:complete len:387 (-),score=122.67 GHVS01007792.1:316-1365(-)
MVSPPAIVHESQLYGIWELDVKGTRRGEKRRRGLFWKCFFLLDVWNKLVRRTIGAEQLTVGGGDDQIVIFEDIPKQTTQQINQSSSGSSSGGSTGVSSGSSGSVSSVSSGSVSASDVVADSSSSDNSTTTIKRGGRHKDPFIRFVVGCLSSLSSMFGKQTQQYVVSRQLAKFGRSIRLPSSECILSVVLSPDRTASILGTTARGVWELKRWLTKTKLQIEVYVQDVELQLRVKQQLGRLNKTNKQTTNAVKTEEDVDGNDNLLLLLFEVDVKLTPSTTNKHSLVLSFGQQHQHNTTTQHHTYDATRGDVGGVGKVWVLSYPYVPWQKELLGTFTVKPPTQKSIVDSCLH